MYKKIFLPVDMAHLEKLDKSLTTAAALANTFNIPVAYVGVTTEQPSAVAYTPEEFEQKLTAFADAQAKAHGITAEAHSYASHDPSVDLDRTLLRAIKLRAIKLRAIKLRAIKLRAIKLRAIKLRAIKETGADLVVMAGYVPSLADYLRRSHESVVVARSGVSVFIVR